MNKNESIFVLIADDDIDVLRNYESQLQAKTPTRSSLRLELLESELFTASAPQLDTRPIHTTTCRQGADAVSLVRDAVERGSRFDVVILDIRMPPGITGVDAAALIRDFDKSVPIIFISGYSDITHDVIIQRVPPPDRMRYLQKPVKLQKLTHTIAEVAALAESC